MHNNTHLPHLKSWERWGLSLLAQEQKYYAVMLFPVQTNIRISESSPARPPAPEDYTLCTRLTATVTQHRICIDILSSLRYQYPKGRA
jgi:hypothetical protein